MLSSHPNRRSRPFSRHAPPLIPTARSGYASLFGEIDHARDIIMRGAFADTLASRAIRRIPCCSARPSEPVGIWLELREDSRGAGARVRAVKHATSKASCHARARVPSGKVGEATRGSAPAVNSRGRQSPCGI